MKICNNKQLFFRTDVGFKNGHFIFTRGTDCDAVEWPVHQEVHWPSCRTVLSSERVGVRWDHFNWCWDSVIKTSTWKYDFKKKCLWPGWHWWQPSWLLYGQWILSKEHSTDGYYHPKKKKLKQKCNYFKNFVLLINKYFTSSQIGHILFSVNIVFCPSIQRMVFKYGRYQVHFTKYAFLKTCNLLEAYSVVLYCKR